MLHHIEIYVSNLEKSIKFWGWFLKKLNYKKFQKWDEGISWKKGETYLVFVQTKKKYLDISYHRCRVGLNHLAFHASSKRAVDEMIKSLEKRNIKILYPDKHPHAGGSQYYGVFFEDPDRIKVEFCI
ncbi:MAG: VOC family protein [Deltaproteobacteria bacterium]|nr:VOC family protein [Deltaproteobacteria bacterium]